MGGGEGLGDHPADRNAGERELLQPQMFHQPREVVHMVRKRIGRRRRIGEAVPALVVGNDAIALRQRSDQPVPDAGVGTERIDQHQRRRVA